MLTRFNYEKYLIKLSKDFIWSFKIGCGLAIMDSQSATRLLGLILFILFIYLHKQQQQFWQQETEFALVG